MNKAVVKVGKKEEKKGSKQTLHERNDFRLFFLDLSYEKRLKSCPDKGAPRRSNLF